MSSYRRVAEGVYERHGKFYFKFREDGKARWSEGFTSSEAASEARIRRLEAKAARRVGDETVDSFVGRWTNDYPRSPQTDSYNGERVKKFGKDFAGRTLRSITRVEARQWANDNWGRVSSVRAMFTDAVADRLADENPFYGLKRPNKRYSKRSKVVLSEPELHMLAHTAEDVWGDFGADMFGPMILTAAHTGLRPGELYALRWEDVDWENEFIDVGWQWNARLKKKTKPKGGRLREIPLLPQTAAAIRSVNPRPADPAEPLFRTVRGGPFTQRVHHYYWDPVRKAFWQRLSGKRREQVPADMDFYELRHYFGTMLARNNFSAMMIAQVMGHTDGGKTAMEHYIKLDGADAREAMVKHFRRQQLEGVSQESADRRTETG